MFRTRIKVCGMTNAAQAQAAVDLGVDAIGMILHADSPRTIGYEQARLIRNVVPAFVNLVGVFVDASAQKIEQAVNEIGLDIVQLHGDEPPAMLEELNRPVIKALRAKQLTQVLDSLNEFHLAQAILLDPYHPKKHGGTGKRLDRSLWPSTAQTPESLRLILAGGLGPTNISESLEMFSPYAVDLNSGVESSPGVKDMTKLRSVCDSVRAYDLGIGSV